jgi:hypothetical protein
MNGICALERSWGNLFVSLAFGPGSLWHSHRHHQWSRKPNTESTGALILTSSFQTGRNKFLPFTNYSG